MVKVMDFRLTYDNLDKRVRKRSSVNLEYVTFVRNRENNYVYLLIVLVVADLIHYVIGRTISNYIGSWFYCICMDCFKTTT